MTDEPASSPSVTTTLEKIDARLTVLGEVLDRIGERTAPDLKLDVTPPSNSGSLQGQADRLLYRTNAVIMLAERIEGAL